MGQTKARKAKQLAAAEAAAKGGQTVVPGQAVSAQPAQPAATEPKTKKRKQPDPTDNPPAQTPDGRVFVGNMPLDVTEDSLRTHFGPCGEIEHILWIQPSGQFKGCGYLQFSDTKVAASAVGMTGTKLWGRKLTVSLPKPRPIDSCKHCKRSGHVAKECDFGDKPSERFIMCERSEPSTCFRRQFIVPLRRASHHFDPNASYREQGRLDVGLRCVSATLFRSQSLRHNSQVLLCFGASDHFVEVDGALVRDLRPDETHLATRISTSVPWASHAPNWPSKEQRGLALHAGGVLVALECALEQAGDSKVAVMLLDTTSAAQSVVSRCSKLPSVLRGGCGTWAC